MRLFSRPFFILFFTLQIICTFLLFVYTFWLKRVSVELRTVRDGRSIQLDDSQRISFSERYRKKRLSGMNGLYNRKENEVIELCAEDTDNEAEDVNDRIGYLEDMPLIDYTEDHDINLEDNQEDMILHAQDIIEYTSGARVFETEVFSSIQNEKSNLLGTLFAIIGGIFSSHGMILAKSGYQSSIHSFIHYHLLVLDW